MRERGNYGEDMAVRLLKKEGYQILERNYYCRMGEIDIIAKDGEYIVFVEVKLRKNNDFGGASFAIDKRKQEKIRKTALYYLQRFPTEVSVRFDAVLITAGDGKIQNKDMELIQNAFC